MDTCTAGACAWSVQVAFLVFGDICHEHVVATSGCSVLGLIATVNASCQVQSCTKALIKHAMIPLTPAKLSAHAAKLLEYMILFVAQ